MSKKGLFNLNLIEEYGLEIIERDVKIVPTAVFNKLKDSREDVE